MNNISRRKFLQSSILTAASLSVPARSWSQALSASEIVNVVVVGTGGRGGNHIEGMTKLESKGVRVVGLCDVDKNHVEGHAKVLRKDNQKITTYTDIRKVLEDRGVDAITIATPNHWHSLATIWAVQAGKDVYVEKPISHNVWEGRQVVEAARKYKKIVQAGTQSRSSHGIKEAVEWVRQGNLGKILIARALCYKPRASIGKVDGPQPVPPEVDYDLWCGPAPKDPPMRKKFHYDWHWFWNYGNGDLGNQGIHQMDIARWFLGVHELSPRVWSVGGRLGYEDSGETANTQIVYHGYAGAPLIFEVRGLPRDKDRAAKNWAGRDMDKFKHPTAGAWMAKDRKTGELKEVESSVAVVIHCEGGYVLVPNYSSAIAFDKEGKEIQQFSGAEDHFENFIKAVRSRKQTDLNGDILEGHLSSALCHTGNVSYRLGKKQSPDEIRGQVKGDKDAVETFGRMQEHLAANGVDLNVNKVNLGVPLKMDPKTERFIGNAAASKLLTRDYRKPYVVPEKV
jgi:predicted dehydrogenase